jgi:hypothetical protein
MLDQPPSFTALYTNIPGRNRHRLSGPVSAITYLAWRMQLGDFGFFFFVLDAGVADVGGAARPDAEAGDFFVGVFGAIARPEDAHSRGCVTRVLDQTGFGCGSARVFGIRFLNR